MINNYKTEVEGAFKLGYKIGRGHGYIEGILTMQTSTTTSINYIGIINTNDIIDIEKAVEGMATNDELRDRLDKLIDKVSEMDKKLAIIEYNTSKKERSKDRGFYILITFISVVVTGGIVALITELL